MTNDRTQRPPVRTAQLLIDLATDPLDPGYAAAAKRRSGGAAPQSGWAYHGAVALGCLLIGFTLVVAYVHTHRSAPETAKVHQSLVSRVKSAERDGDRLAAQAEQLDSQVNAVRDEALGGAGRLDATLNRTQVDSGDVPVTGPGLQVVLSDPSAASASPTPGRAGSVPIGSTHILTDRDVRSVVNELWADGAEAISVNDIRLTPTSAVRFAGEAVLVDFQPITSPYTIRAIGNADGLATAFAASAVASRYQTVSSAKGIGFSFTERASVTLPAATTARPRYATVPTASPSPAASSRPSVSSTPSPSVSPSPEGTR